MQSAFSFPSGVATRAQLLQWSNAGHLYCLLDPFFKLPPQDSPSESVKLELRDTDLDFFEMIAWDRVTFESPTLSKVNEKDLSWLLDAVATERWGVFVVSPQGLKEVAEHLQKFVIVRGPDQYPYFLRFQDAAVLQTLLKTWSDADRKLFYGPVHAFGLLNLDSLEIEMVFKARATQMILAEVAVDTKPVPEDCLLELTSEQLLACSDAIEQDLVRILYWHLVNNHSDSVQHVPREELQRRIEVGLARARMHRLSTMSSLAGFVALMFELSPNFDEHPKFKGLLEDESIPSDSKMKLLAHVITERDWHEARLMADPHFWRDSSAASKSKARKRA